MSNRPTVLDTADMVVVPKEPVGKQRRYKLSDDDWSPWYGQSALLPDKFANQYEDRPVYASPHPTAWEEVIAWEAEQAKRIRELEARLKNAYEIKFRCNEDANFERKRANTAEARLEAAEAKANAFEAALTPSIETKCEYMSEFYMGITMRAGGQEEFRRVPIPWTSIKEIMKAISSHAAAKWMEGRNAEV